MPFGGQSRSFSDQPTKPIQVDSLFRTLPSERTARWILLKEFFNGWYGQLGPDDGFELQHIRAAEERLSIRLPLALCEWYALAGRRADVWSCQDQFLEPEAIRIEGEKLIIYVENQSVVKWGISLDALRLREDPAVYVSDQNDPEEWFEEAPSVSIFALSQMLLGVKFSDSTTFTANGEATDKGLAVISRNYERLDFPDLHWPPYPSRFYGGHDLLIETEADSWIWVSARNQDSFRLAVECVSSAGVEWTERTER
jgi:hypothetical protein